MSGPHDWAKRISYYDEPESGTDLVRVVLYGNTGCGKTTAAATWPKPFFIDTDRGGKVLNDLHIPHASFERGDKVYRPILDVLKSLRKKSDPFDKIEVETLVIDGLTNLAEFLLVESMLFPDNPKIHTKDPASYKPEFDHWQNLLSRMQEIIKRSQNLGVNIVATAGQKLDRDEIMGTYVGEPNIQGSYRHIIGHDFDEFYYLDAVTRKKGGELETHYYAYTVPHGYFVAKTRTKGLPPEIEDLTYQKIRKYEEGAKKERVSGSKDRATVRA